MFSAVYIPFWLKVFFVSAAGTIVGNLTCKRCEKVKEHLDDSKAHHEKENRTNPNNQ